ncbi:MAG: DUF885 domain-containing protein [candidate division Zixibacteria bacterium]|nr:DUF885 domain-containing protein [candidate division Zixibacteria bacterium]
MDRKYLIFIALAVLVLIAGSGSDAATTQDKVDGLSQEILESLESFYPVMATERGNHAFDHRLADYSSKSVSNMTKKLSGFIKDLHKYRDADLGTDGSINYRLIRSNVEIALMDLKHVKWYTKSPQLYVDEAVNGLYFLMLSQHAPMSEKLYSVIARMKAVPDLFATARKNLRKPPPVYVDLAQESLESAQQFYKEVSGSLMREFPERADEISGVATRAREAMNDFAVYLTGIEQGEPTSFALGKDNFDYLLQHHYFLTIDCDSLLTIGESLLAETRAAYMDYRDYVEANYQNGRDSVFVPAVFTRDDILNYYQWETDQVKLFLTLNDILTVPEDIAPLKVVETPPFLRSMVGGIAYQPAGPFDSNQVGLFYLRPVPEDLDRRQLEARYRYVHRRGFKGSVVHEGFPGHHLQMQIAGMNPNPVRKWQHNAMMVEGWALYCEEMMYRAGLFGEEDPVQWLAILGGQMYRAARIVADVKLHTGQFTYEECVDWMTETLFAETEADKNYHRTMVRKYTLTPGNWMAYLMGKREIEHLYDAAVERDGAEFVEQDFYDALLEQGSIPPTLIGEALGLQP